MGLFIFLPLTLFTKVILKLQIVRSFPQSEEIKKAKYALDK